jgi:hypothetical protein
MTEQDAAIRLFVYETAVKTGRPPSPLETARRFGLLPMETALAFRRLQDEHDALVLVPGSAYIWMAEPFSALPTDYPVHSLGTRGTRWFGNCVWDALAIAALVGVDADIPTACPASGADLTLAVRDGTLRPIDAVVHFAVRPKDWWVSVGFT